MQVFFYLFIIVFVIMFTCDLADSEVVSSASLRVPGCALDAVGSSCLKVIKGHCGVSGVQFDTGTGALLDDAECVKDSVLHWEPRHKDGVIARGGGVQLKRDHHCRQRQTESNEQ